MLVEMRKADFGGGSGSVRTPNNQLCILQPAAEDPPASLKKISLLGILAAWRQALWTVYLLQRLHIASQRLPSIPVTSNYLISYRSLRVGGGCECVYYFGGGSGSVRTPNNQLCILQPAAEDPPASLKKISLLGILAAWRQALWTVYLLQRLHIASQRLPSIPVTSNYLISYRSLRVGGGCECVYYFGGGSGSVRTPNNQLCILQSKMATGFTNTCLSCNEALSEKSLKMKCVECEYSYHLGACSGIQESTFKTKGESWHSAWRCQTCRISKQRSSKPKKDSEVDVMVALAAMNKKLDSLLDLKETVNGIEQAIQMLSDKYDGMTVLIT
ncbi:uncharacterized protein LOC121834791 [Ixodes scapularis]|uniref:uncharacterized protein LOC121834791 n=1 Tax=Ixodes scapularis TaxID=6945 RepID=UPI001C393447|nr:uncharacterized protein LOC121834791 [Ixodes scapularis]